MTKKLTLTLATAIALLTASSAFANTISVGPITNAPDGSGGMLWTYPIMFSNSTVSSAQPTSFNLNDFGALKTTGPLPSGFSFSPSVTFTLDNTQNVGPNFGLPGFEPNNASVRDVVVTFTGNGTTGAGLVTFNLVLDTALTGTGGLANFFSQDIVATGDLGGTPNAVQENILTPAGVPILTPEPGVMTTMLLGAAGLGLLFFRKLSQAS
jgi:hypothetical protein